MRHTPQEVRVSASEHTPGGERRDKDRRWWTVQVACKTSPWLPTCIWQSAGDGASCEVESELRYAIPGSTNAPRMLNRLAKPSVKA
jgi:hypothetical protein